jgi:hypothetical protein
MDQHAEAFSITENRRARRVGSVALGLAAVSLGLLLGTGPVGILVAPLAFIVGIFDLILLQPRTSSRRAGGYGRAVSATVIGVLVTIASVVVMAGSQAT